MEDTPLNNEIEDTLDNESLPENTESMSIVPSKHVFYVLGARMDYLLPILPYAQLKREMDGMEDVFQKIYKFPLSEIEYDENAKKKLRGYTLKFFKRYRALEEQEELYNSIKKLNIPYENIHIKCYKQAYINIVKSYIGFTPLKVNRLKNSEITESLYQEILHFSANVASEVIVIGHSYGGAIINRVALLMHQQLPTPPTNVYFLGFGSIYIPRKRYEPFNVNLINYLSLGDVAMKTNWLRAPKFVDLRKAFLDMPLTKWKRKYSDSSPLPIICSFQTNKVDDVEGTLRWICLFDNHKPLCIINGKQRKISAFDWTEHYYNNLMELILTFNQNNVNFISDIDALNNYIIDYEPNNYIVQSGGLTKRKRHIKRQTKKLELVSLG